MFVCVFVQIYDINICVCACVCVFVCAGHASLWPMIILACNLHNKNNNYNKSKIAK